MRPRPRAAPRRDVGAAGTRRRLSRRGDPGLYAYAPRAGRPLAALPVGVLRDVRARLGALRRSAAARQRAAPRLRRARGQRIAFDREAIAEDLGFDAGTRNSVDV